MKGRTPRRRRAPLRRRKTALEIANSARRRGEAALGESERRYRDLVENSLGLICSHDLDGHLLFVNPAAARSLGYESKDGIGKNLRDFLAPDTRHLFDDYLRRIRENGIDDGLMKLVTSEGRERMWMYRNVRRDASGKPSYVVGHALDVTDRVLIERAFRASQEASHRALRELETRVEDRTAELQLLNNRLRAEIMERTRAVEMRDFMQRHEFDTLAFLATCSDRLTHVLDYETTLVTLERLPVPFLADCTISCVLNEDGTCRSIRGHHATVEGQSALEQLVSSAPRHLSADTLVARITAGRRAELIAHTPDEFATRFLGSGPHVEHLQKLVFGDVVIVPLVVDNRVIGALSLISNALGRYTRSELAVIEDLIRRFQVAIELIRLHREVRDANRLKDEYLARVSHKPGRR